MSEPTINIPQFDNLRELFERSSIALKERPELRVTDFKNFEYIANHLVKVAYLQGLKDASTNLTSMIKEVFQIKEELV